MKWISVDDRLPEISEKVLWYHKEFDECDAEYYTERMPSLGYTHWMPLPDPPEGE